MDIGELSVLANTDEDQIVEKNAVPARELTRRLHSMLEIAMPAYFEDMQDEEGQAGLKGPVR